MITVFYDDRPCGCGKTYEALALIARNGGRHLFVVERREAMRERVATLNSLLDVGHSLDIRSICARSARRYGQPSVRLEVEAVPTCASRDAVVFITHEAMKLADLSSFAGQDWCIWIDEVPSVLDQDHHRFELSWETLASYYALEPVDAKWSRVRLSSDAPDLAMLSRDDALAVLRPFHRRVSDIRREVYVRLRAWSELGAKNHDMAWFCLWSPKELASFRAVFLLGNQLTQSATFRLWRERWPDVVWQPLATATLAFIPRRVTIRYFVVAHRASRGLFETEAGQANLTAIAAYVGRTADDARHIWTCNHADEPFLRDLPGRHLSPAQSGSNSFTYADQATMIYAAKPSSMVRGVYARIGVDPDIHTVSAELEAIVQFACRTSIRLADDPRDITINVYDQHQAIYLRDHFTADVRGHVTVDVVLEDLGFAHDVRCNRPGRKNVPRTAEEEAAIIAIRRQKDRNRKRLSRKRALEDLGGESMSCYKADHSLTPSS